jgi:hypothetical protein
MSVIQQSVDIPENRRLLLDLTLPEDVPAGKAHVLVFFSPSETSGKTLYVQPAKHKSLGDSPVFGMWADREDMRDPVEWVKAQRDFARNAD